MANQRRIFGRREKVQAIEREPKSVKLAKGQRQETYRGKYERLGIHKYAVTIWLF